MKNEKMIKNKKSIGLRVIKYYIFSQHRKTDSYYCDYNFEERRKIGKFRND
jgi:hypothetical protein